MKFYVIGIDDGAQPHFTAEVEAIIACGKVFSGGARHHQIVKELLPEGAKWIDITPPMSTLFDHYTLHDEVVVFASGDPLFYGFGSTLQRYNPSAEMVLFPTFNSLQRLAHKAQIAYHNMKNISLTGREWHLFDSSLIEGEALIGVLTDTREHTPDKIAQRMLRYGYTNYRITVGEQLGNQEHEKIESYTTAEAAVREFSHPCCMIMERTHSRRKSFGIADNQFRGLEGRSKMITKMPIRLTLLSQLELEESNYFWDVGFCTGSVSIEAKLLFPQLRVVSFEKREECGEIMESNMLKFGALGIDYYICDFMECDTESLPSPDAIFIGGHGGNLASIVERCYQKLRDGGRILFNSVSEHSESQFLDAAESCALKVDSITSIKVDDFNTIKIIKTVK